MHAAWEWKEMCISWFVSARVTGATYTIICIVIKYQLTAEKNKADNILIYCKPFNLPGTKRNNILLKMKKGCRFRKNLFLNKLLVVAHACSCLLQNLIHLRQIDWMEQSVYALYFGQNWDNDIQDFARTKVFANPRFFKCNIIIIEEQEFR